MNRSRQTELVELVTSLWPGKAAPLCSEGAELLRTFVIARPADLSFITSHDMIDLQSSAFQGIPEWDAFAGHVWRCSSCDSRSVSR